MDIRRIVLFSALALVIYSLWTSWQGDYPPPAVLQVVSSVKAINDNPMLPMMAPGESESEVKANPDMAVNTQAFGESKKITVKTDVLNLVIDLKQGDIISALLVDYPVNAEEKNTPFTLLQDRPGERYVANSSLFQVDGHKIENIDFNFTSAQSDYQLTADQKQLVVTLSGKTANGLEAKKEFRFSRGNYLIEVRYLVANEGAASWKGYMNTQLLRTSPQEDKSSMFHVGSYTGASYSNPGQSRYQKVNFKDMTKSNLDVEVQGGWLAMQQHYFLTAWVPVVDSKNRFYTRSFEGDYTIGAVSPPITVAPAEKQEISSRLYLGPEVTSTLKAIAPSLDLTVDYGWLWFVSSLLFSLMKTIYSVVGNWGWSIVLVTMLIKLAFYRLSATSYKSMAGMRKLQPKLAALRERYGDDKAKISQATMELYRQEKVNPLGGCLPIIIQIPVFIALYWVLLKVLNCAKHRLFSGLKIWQPLIPSMYCR